MLLSQLASEGMARSVKRRMYFHRLVRIMRCGSYWPW